MKSRSINAKNHYFDFKLHFILSEKNAILLFENMLKASSYVVVESVRISVEWRNGFRMKNANWNNFCCLSQLDMLVRLS